MFKPKIIMQENKDDFWKIGFPVLLIIVSIALLIYLFIFVF